VVRQNAATLAWGVAVHRDDDMLSKRELAEALNVSVRTIERWHALGTGPPAIRLPGGQLRWRWSAVQAWLEHRGESGG
jgi:excisionase family DNA binding protein